MRIVDAKCPKCGAQLKIDPANKTVICDFCGAQLFLEKEGLRLFPGESEEAGYLFEKGRQKAIEEQKHTKRRRLFCILIVSIAEIAVIVGVVAYFQHAAQEKQIQVSNTDADNEPTETMDSEETQQDEEQEIVKDVVVPAVTEEMSSEYLAKSEEAETADICDDDFEIVENLGRYTRWDDIALIEMTNHSGQVVSVYANAVAYDEAGNPIGAGDERSVPFADGETVILPINFPETESIDKIACTYTYNKAKTSYIANLEESHTVVNDRVIVSVTNTGEEPVSFPRADLLFYDRNGNLIWWDYNYFDNETGAFLTPGATITKQIEAPQGFQDVRVILSGEP